MKMLKNCLACFTALEEDFICPICGFDNAAYIPEPHHLPPETILHGRYVIGRALGDGGFGITYVGYDLVLRRKVAVKEYFPGGSVWRSSETSLNVSCHTSKSLQEQFDVGRKKCIREAQSLAKLDDIPAIVRVLDFFSENNTAYIIMEFVEGSTLKDYVKRLPRRMTLAEILELLSPVTDALQIVHKRGFVHRDISPDNIMIAADGTAKLLDFGAVKSVSAGGEATQNPVVKRGFSPLELYSTEGLIGVWTDVYALCATIYYLLTGEVPEEPMDRLANDRAEEKLAALLPPEEKDALCKGLAIQPKERFQTLEPLLDVLNPQAKQETPNVEESDQASELAESANRTETHPNTTLEPHRKKPRTKAVLALLMAVFAVATIVLSVFLILFVQDRDHYRDRYRESLDELDKTKTQYNTLKTKYDNISDEYNFYHSYAVVCPDDGSGLYHQYSCSKLDDSNGVWIYNTKAAESRGFEPCPNCIKS